MRTSTTVVTIKCIITYLLLSNAATAAETYRTSISGEYSSQLYDDIEDTKVSDNRLSSTIHFAPVKTTGYIHKEAAFLQRSGDITVNLGKGRIRETGDPTIHSSVYGIVATFMKSQRPYWAQLGYSKDAYDYNDSFDSESSSNTYLISGGYFLPIGALIYGRYSLIDGKFDIYGLSTSDWDIKVYEIGTKFVKQKQTKGYALEASYSPVRFNFDGVSWDFDFDRYSIHGDYFFTHQLSVGSDVSVITGKDDSAEGVSYLLNACLYLSRYFSLTISQEQFNAAHRIGDDTSTFTASAAIRF